MLKKIIVTTLLVGLTSTPIIVYAKNAWGGFNGPSVPVSVTTVEQAKKAWDETPVILKGYIINHIHDDRYTFKDSTGTVQVDIDKDHWYGVVAGPTTLVEIGGEVDKDWNETEIDVDYVRLTQ